MHCPACHKENPSGATHCEFCRTPLPDPSSQFQPTVPVSGVSVGDARFEQGSLIAGRYLVERELGRGGMGVVYLVRDQRLHGKELALKLIASDLVASPQGPDRFAREVLAAQELQHPNIVRVYHLDEVAGQSFFTMEFVPGKSLREIIEHRKREGRTFSLEECLSVLVPVLEALQHAHTHTPPVIHRDIKPDNIIVTGDFLSSQVKVLDFGLAKMLSPSRLTTTAMTMGTAYYMAPEQVQGARDIDQRADVFSVGVILYEMLTGRIPSGRFKLPSKLINRLPSLIDDFIDEVLQQDPEDRYESAGEMAEELRSVIQSVNGQIRKLERKTEEKVRKNRGQIKGEEKRKSEEEGDWRQKKEELEQKRLTEMVASFKGWENSGFKTKVEVRNRMEEVVSLNNGKDVKYKASEDLRLKAKNDAYLKAEDEFENEAEVITWREPLTGMEFAWVPGGCYQMGSNDGCSDESPLHEVCLDGFWLGRYEVTQAEWARVMGNHPAHFSGERHPVEGVSWKDVQEFIGKLNSEGSGRFRLPTEAEWEYAARSGGKDEKYAGSDYVDRVSWYDVNSQEKTHPVGSKASNGLGLYDMGGNVWEWCQDVYEFSAYSKHSRNNPIISGDGFRRVCRGGSWNDHQIDVELTRRSSRSPENRFFNLGFRLVGEEVVALDADEKARRKAIERYQRKALKRSRSKELKTALREANIWREPLTGMEFVWVPGGCYQMGGNDGESEESPVHEVCLDGFWMGRYEVTQAEWQLIMGSNPSYFKGDRNPVENVSWHEVQVFIGKLNSNGGEKISLPTEAEWEYAARSGGRDEEYAGGNDVDRFAWYDYNSSGTTHPVGTKNPNGLGLYDMSGNVWEWCQDVYDPSAYFKHTQRNPVLSGHSSRVKRGGSWRDFLRCVRATYRNGIPDYKGYDLGFRLVKSQETVDRDESARDMVSAIESPNRSTYKEAMSKEREPVDTDLLKLSEAEAEAWRMIQEEAWQKEREAVEFFAADRDESAREW